MATLALSFDSIPLGSECVFWCFRYSVVLIRDEFRVITALLFSTRRQRISLTAGSSQFPGFFCFVFFILSVYLNFPFFSVSSIDSMSKSKENSYQYIENVQTSSNITATFQVFDLCDYAKQD